MRKTIVSNFVTVDGFFAGPKEELDWFVWDEETADFMKEAFGTIDTLLFGRVTYELMVGYWPTASPPTDDPVIIEAMNTFPKIVFSKTLEKVEWNNSRLVKENIVEEISMMKQLPGKDMVIFGSGSIVTAFAQAGLIDEYRLFVNPVVLGSGKPLFKGLHARLQLKLSRAKTFRSGVVLLQYEPGTEINRVYPSQAHERKR